MIKVTEHYTIKADDYCYMVGEVKSGKDGKIKFDHPTYYIRIEQAVQSAIDRETRRQVAEGKITSLSGFMERYKEISEGVKRKIDSLTAVEG